MAKQNLIIPSCVQHVPPRKFKLDRHSEYYHDDRIQMKQYQMLNFKKLYFEYSRIIIFDMNNVRGSTLSELRRDLRIDYQSELFVGKNTVVRRMIEELEESSRSNSSADEITSSREVNALKQLRNHMVGPICLLFTDCDALKMKQFVESRVTNELPQPGYKMEEDLYLEPHVTWLEPTQTSNFASLGVATKITKGKIEILNRPLILQKGQILNPTIRRFLARLDMKPCKRGCKALSIYEKHDYCIFPCQILYHNLNPSIYEAVNNVGSITMQGNLFNQLSIIIDLKKGIHNLLAIECEMEHSENY